MCKIIEIHELQKGEKDYVAVKSPDDFYPCSDFVLGLFRPKHKRWKWNNIPNQLPGD